MRLPIRAVAVLCLALAGLTACSLAGFGYDIAPRLAVRYADDYLQLNTRQEARALELFRARKEVHQAEELPQYAVFISDVEERFERGLQEQDFDYAFSRANELWSIAVHRTVPAIAKILADLDDDQLGALEDKLADSEERYRERIEEHDPEERLDEAIEDIEEWTGDLDDEQREFVRERLGKLNDTRVAWLQWRIERNARLIELLKKHPGVDAIEEFMRTSWANREGIDPELRKASDENRKIYRNLLVELDASLKPDQRDKVAEKLADYREIVWDLLPEEERMALEKQRENESPSTGSESMGTQ